MFVLGHIGFGRVIAGSRGRALPVAPFLLGAILPDLIDKPLYYVHAWDYVTCTRTFGHTGLLLGTLGVIALLKRSPVWTAVALAMATHLMLDGVMDLQSSVTSSTWMAFTWPFGYGRFADYQITMSQHFWLLWRPDILVTETIGLVLILREYRKRRLTPL